MPLAGDLGVPTLTRNVDVRSGSAGVPPRSSSWPSNRGRFKSGVDAAGLLILKVDGNASFGLWLFLQQENSFSRTAGSNSLIMDTDTPCAVIKELSM